MSNALGSILHCNVAVVTLCSVTNKGDGLYSLAAKLYCDTTNFLPITCASMLLATTSLAIMLQGNREKL